MRISDWSSAVCSSDLFKASLYASDVEDVLKKQYVNANYGPLALMALGLVLRSVSFEFRIRARAELKPRWILGFWLGSVATAFGQGMILGRIATGYQTAADRKSVV